MPTLLKTNNDFLKAWKREVAPFRRALFPVLQKQKRTVARRVRELSETRTVLEPTDAALLYPHGMAEDVRKVANEQIARGMRHGARQELSQVRRLKKRARVELPLEVQEQISDAIDEMFSSYFWENNFGNATRRRISNLLFTATTQGWTLQETAQALSQDKFGAFTKTRADRVARTEITAALNSGAWISRQSALDEGVLLGEEWNAILDDRLRRKHRFAHGQVVERDSIGDWYVRGADGITLAEGRAFLLVNERARFPGDPNLSAGNRIHCRCTVEAVV